MSLRPPASRRRVLLVLLALLAVAGGAFLAWRATRSDATPPAPATGAGNAATATDPEQLRYPKGAAQLAMIRAEAMPRVPLPLAEPLSARLVYDEDATARIGVGFSGRIVALRVGPGDSVRAGQVLADIDSPDYGTARADLGKALADEKRKQLAAERGRELAPGDAIPRKDLEALEADHAQAVEEVERARRRLQNMNPRGLRGEGQRLQLVSPMDGLVAERTATPALEVAPGMAAPLFVVTDPRRLWLMIDLPERLLGRIKLGSAVSVESDAYPGRRFAATVRQVGHAVDTNTRRVPVRAQLDNAGLELLPEMFVRAQLLQEDGSGVRVPNEALVNRGVHNYVFVEESPGAFRRRQVELLAQGSDRSYVREGLAGNERVVTAGALLLDAELTTRASERP